MATTLEAPNPGWDIEEMRPDVSHLVTEDDTPVDNSFCEKQMRLLTHPLYAAWNPGQPFVVMANVGVYFALNRPPMVPDTLVSLGVSTPVGVTPKERKAYFLWLYGKAPDIVVEIVSNKEGGELDRKMDGYAWHGVPYYVVFDPDLHIQDRKLRCYRLVDNAYEPMSENHFPKIGLGVVEWDGEFEKQQDHWIRWVGAGGELIPTGEEMAEASARHAQAEAKRARAEAKLAQTASKRAEAETKRAEALAAKLRELGVDPDSITGA